MGTTMVGISRSTGWAEIPQFGFRKTRSTKDGTNLVCFKEYHAFTFSQRISYMTGSLFKWACSVDRGQKGLGGFARSVRRRLTSGIYDTGAHVYLAFKTKKSPKILRCNVLHGIMPATRRRSGDTDLVETWALMRLIHDGFLTLRIFTIDRAMADIGLQERQPELTLLISSETGRIPCA